MGDPLLQGGKPVGQDAVVFEGGACYAQGIELIEYSFVIPHFETPSSMTYPHFVHTQPSAGMTTARIAHYPQSLQ